MTSLGGELRVYPDRLANNARLLQGSAGPNLIAVVKGDGYGLGLATCAQAFAGAGISILAVADLDEAIAVRQAGVTTRLLILQPDSVAASPELSAEWLVGQVEVDMLLRPPGNSEAETVVHLDIDFGVGRGGVAPRDADAVLDRLVNLRHIRVAGIAGHLPSQPDERCFLHAVALLERLRTHNPGAIVHVGGSDAMAWQHLAPHAWLRIGRPLYGVLPRRLVGGREGLTYAWAWTAKAVPFKAPMTGGYTARHRSSGTPMRLSVGYAHGLPATAAGRWPVLIGGRHYRISDVYMLSSVAYPCDEEAPVAADEALLSGEVVDRLPVRDISDSLGISTTAVMLAPRSARTVAA